MPRSRTNPPNHVIFVPGGGGDQWEYRIWSRVFAAHGYQPEAMSFGRQNQKIGEVDFTQYRQRIVDRISANSVLVGASLGAALVYDIARKRSLPAVLINPALPVSLKAYSGLVGEKIKPWSDTSWNSHRRHMHRASDMTALQTSQLWEDESVRVLKTAAELEWTHPPQGKCLLITGQRDKTVCSSSIFKIAETWQCPVLAYADEDHLSPLLGTRAGSIATDVVRWLGDQWRVL